jgi:hypothetical protein
MPASRAAGDSLREHSDASSGRGGAVAGVDGAGHTEEATREEPSPVRSSMGEGRVDPYPHA